MIERRSTGGPVRGLMLVVAGEGAAWILRYYQGGRERWHGLGSARIVGLRDARSKLLRL